MKPKKMSPRQLDKLLTIGADPEFGFLKPSGAIISAGDLIQTSRNYSNMFGLDGCGAIAEVRPKPSTVPADVVKSIQYLMRCGASRFPAITRYEWKAGATLDGYALGGHIHFGLLGLPVPVTKEMESSLGMALDIFLSVPLLAIENHTEARLRRCVSGYGVLSDMRAQRWGAEYRTPSSWLVSKKAALGVLSLAKVIACESLAGRIAHVPKVLAKRFYDATLPRKMTMDAWSSVRKMSLYKKYKCPIMYLERLFLARKTWEAGDLKEEWGIRVPPVAPAPAPSAVPSTLNEMSSSAQSLSSIWQGTRSHRYTLRYLRLDSASVSPNVLPLPADIANPLVAVSIDPAPVSQP